MLEKHGVFILRCETVLLRFCLCSCVLESKRYWNWLPPRFNSSFSFEGHTKGMFFEPNYSATSNMLLPLSGWSRAICLEVQNLTHLSSLHSWSFILKARSFWLFFFLFLFLFFFCAYSILPHTSSHTSSQRAKTSTKGTKLPHRVGYTNDRTHSVQILKTVAFVSNSKKKKQERDS